MTEQKLPELLPCPFCGAPAELERDSDHHGSWFNLGCSRHFGKDIDDQCPAGRLWYTTAPEKESAALAAWNHRVSAPQEQRPPGEEREPNWCCAEIDIGRGKGSRPCAQPMPCPDHGRLFPPRPSEQRPTEPSEAAIAAAVEAFQAPSGDLLEGIVNALRAAYSVEAGK
jgi:hypothetical protein